MELLVVIAIVAVLAALLLPALSGAKARSQLTTCLGNLKQINLGVHLYAGDNGDTLPRAGNTAIYYRELVNSFVGVNHPSSPQDMIFACPADIFSYQGTDPQTYIPHGRHEDATSDFSSYMFNGGNFETNYFTANGFQSGIGGRKLSAIKNSSRTFLVLEAAAFSPFSWHQPKAPVAGVVQFNNSRNMASFADGHTAFIQMYWNEALHDSNGNSSEACFYDPPAGYDYQWSGN